MDDVVSKGWEPKGQLMEPANKGKGKAGVAGKTPIHIRTFSG
jgi:hypothetical protein